ncbi:MAG: hypothetical protein JXB45_03815 [Candidatus Krumholzibacteriota bacterium]|nr:hypothetical protein [Candidatus Krumholzibacteriota bacterium]
MHLDAGASYKLRLITNTLGNLQVWEIMLLGQSDNENPSWGKIKSIYHD